MNASTKSQGSSAGMMPRGEMAVAGGADMPGGAMNAAVIAVAMPSGTMVAAAAAPDMPAGAMQASKPVAGAAAAPDMPPGAMLGAQSGGMPAGAMPGPLPPEGGWNMDVAPYSPCGC